MKYRTWSLESGVGNPGHTWIQGHITTRRHKHWVSTYVCKWSQKEMCIQGCTPSVKARWHREKQNKTKKEKKDETKFQWILSVVSGVSQVCEISGIRYGNGNARDPWEGSLSLSPTLSLSGRASSPQSVLGRGADALISWLWKFRGRASAAWVGFGLVSVVAAWLGLDLAWIMDDVWIASAFGNHVRIYDVRSR